MSVDHVPITSRPRRPSALLLVLGLVVGLVAATALISPAKARTVTPLSAEPLCATVGFSQPPGISNPLALTWSHIGNRTNGGVTYRYWMVQELHGSTLLYRNSYVARCSGVTLLSSATIPTSSAFGTPSCTSSGDYSPPTSASTERYVGQRASRESSFIANLTFRYWHRERLSIVTLTWVYDSSFVARC
ncbi:hypothetical protein [Micromonospora lutea]|uniref:Ig-like domain-containing protein n=1 Tax=Micromonospora lutea TaxID=419825 RepID=A0ABQ4J0C1_9ACTN|nr:hypothetical protein [Micromonospora lutea]GIJ23594.1 hypothetical protein Vlu01_42180 [Micromonospora lutea]